MRLVAGDLADLGNLLVCALFRYEAYPVTHGPTSPAVGSHLHHHGPLDIFANDMLVIRLTIYFYASIPN